jgi:hypothetical protein
LRAISTSLEKPALFLPTLDLTVHFEFDAMLGLLSFFVFYVDNDGTFSGDVFPDPLQFSADSFPPTNLPDNKIPYKASPCSFDLLKFGRDGTRLTSIPFPLHRNSQDVSVKQHHDCHIDFFPRSFIFPTNVIVLPAGDKMRTLNSQKGNVRI